MPDESLVVDLGPVHLPYRSLDLLEGLPPVLPKLLHDQEVSLVELSLRPDPALRRLSIQWKGLAPVEIPYPVLKVEALRAHRRDAEVVAVEVLDGVEDPHVLQPAHHRAKFAVKPQRDTSVKKIGTVSHRRRVGDDITEVAHGGEDLLRDLRVHVGDLDLHHEPLQPERAVVGRRLVGEPVVDDLLLVAVPHALLELS